MRFDREIERIHQKYWDAEVQAAIGKTVLLVEGEDDRAVVESVLDAFVRGWAARFRVVAAGSAKNVFRKRTLFSNRYLLIDRDTQTDAEIAALRHDEGALYVTDGWCLENIFLDPHFVAAFGDASLTNQLERERERWVRAGALWWTLQRAREASQRWWDSLWAGGHYGRPREGCDPTSAEDFRALFAAIAPLNVDIERLAVDFAGRLDEVLKMSPVEQWRVGVHGKAAFKHFFEGSRWDRRSLASRLAHPFPPPLGELIALVRA